MRISATVELWFDGSRRKVFQAAHRHVRDEHDTSIAGKQWFQSCENRLHLIGCDDRHEHDDAVHLVEHWMGGVKAMMSLAGDVVDDRVAGRLVVEQVCGEFQVLALNDDSDLFHRMQRQVRHNYPSFSNALIPARKLAFRLASSRFWERSGSTAALLVRWRSMKPIRCREAPANGADCERFFL